MSGGSFDYAYDKVSRFADELEERLDNAGKRVRPDSIYDDTTEPEWSEAVTVALRDLSIIARHVSRMMHAAEWLYSGDYGEDSFMEEMKAAYDDMENRQ